MTTRITGRIVASAVLLCGVAAGAAAQDMPQTPPPQVPQVPKDTPADPRIERARSAALPNISAEATIRTVSGEVLHQGSNEWVCMPDLNQTPACLDPVWMKFLEAFAGKQPFTTDKMGFAHMLQPDEMAVNNADPFDTTRDPGETWVQEGPHLMIIFPDARILESFAAEPTNGKPYVMWQGTPYAHLMVPVGERP